MRTHAICGLSLAFAAATSAMSTYKDFDWARLPGKTGKHGKTTGEPLPWLSEIKEDNTNQHSYIVRLDCAGCPFKEEHVDNVLLLNFTTSASDGVLLNGWPIVDVASRPPDVDALQIEASNEKLFNAVVKKHRLQRPKEGLTFGTKVPRYALSYEHAILATEKPGQRWLQFGVTALHMHQSGQSYIYKVDQDRQQMVQILLQQTIQDERPVLNVEDIQLVDRKDRAQPIKMKCGKYAIVHFEYDPTEWDVYGKIGTESRMVRLVASKALDFMKGNGLILLVVFVTFGAVKLLRRRVQKLDERAMARDEEEVAPLAVNYESPPDYNEVSEPAEAKEEEDHPLLSVATIEDEKKGAHA